MLWSPTSKPDSDGPSCTVLYSKVSAVQGVSMYVYGDNYIRNALNCHKCSLLRVSKVGFHCTCQDYLMIIKDGPDVIVADKIIIMIKLC